MRPTLYLLAAPLFVAGLLAGPTPADTVVLKNGHRVEGQVVDKGEYIEVELELGTVTYRRDEVQEILSGDKVERPGRRGDGELDEVVLKDGTVVVGRVQVSGDGSTVIVHLAAGEAEADVVYDRDEVREIRWSGKAPDRPGGRDELTRKVVLHLADLKQQGKQEMAREALMNLGVFALPILEEQLEAAEDPLVKAELSRIILVNRTRERIGARVLATHPESPVVLLEGAPEEQLKTLETLYHTDPQGALPLLNFVLDQPQFHPAAQAFALAQMSAHGRYDELIRRLNHPDGRMRLGVAISLGNSGVFLGIPVLIEAMEHADPSVRSIAFERLSDYTDLTFDYDPDAEEGVRAAALAQWRIWWEEAGDAFVEQSLKQTMLKDDISTEDRELARSLWQQGSTLWMSLADGELGSEKRGFELTKVHYFYQKALEADPAFPNARLALAILLHEELGRTNEAVKQLDLLFERFLTEEEQDGVRKQAYLQLARIHEEQGSRERAEGAYRDALVIDPGYLDARVALGALYHDWALAVPHADPRLPRALLLASVEHYREALQVLGDRDRQVEEAGPSLRAMGEDDPLVVGTHRKLVKESAGTMRQKKAALHYAIGRAFMALQQPLEASKAYQAAVKLMPNEPSYAEALEVSKALDEEPTPINADSEEIEALLEMLRRAKEEAVPSEPSPAGESKVP